MNGLILFSLRNPRAITVLMLTIIILGGLTMSSIPADILPVYRSPAVQVLTFYSGMSATNIEKDITARMERWTGQAAGTQLQESRSIIGASIIRNYYTDDIDPAAALTAVNSLASAAIPNLPPGTLPPVILPFDPTSTVPVCLIALNSTSADEKTLYDVGRYEVRNFIMALPGSNAPVVYGGKIRTVLAYVNQVEMQARNLTLVDVMNAIQDYNVFLAAGLARFANTDYAVDSNALYEYASDMDNIPIKFEGKRPVFVGDVAKTKDTAIMQTNIVRVGDPLHPGRKQVYIPVYRQLGSSTLNVVGNLRNSIEDMTNRVSINGDKTVVDLKLVMDQSIYVSKAIESLAEEGILGAFLCSMVILLFLGEWRMTFIAVTTIPVAVLGAIGALSTSGNTINVMTLSGLALAIGPMVDSAIICLENTHRHLGLGARLKQAAYLGASEVAMPELVASLCTLLVLAPLAMMPGLGTFLFKPMFAAVSFAMIIAYVLSRSYVPTRCAAWLHEHAPGHGHGGAHTSHDDHGHHFESDAIVFGNESHGNGHNGHNGNGHNGHNGNGHSAKKKFFLFALIGGLFAKWEAVINVGIGMYVRVLNLVMRARVLTVVVAFSILAVTIGTLGVNLRQEFFPEVDSGAFEIYARAQSGTQLYKTEELIAVVEQHIKDVCRLPGTEIPPEEELSKGGKGKEGAKKEKEEKPWTDLDLIVTEIGVTADWSAAFTPNAGTMDCVLKVQLKPERSKSAQEYVSLLRKDFNRGIDSKNGSDPVAVHKNEVFGQFEFAFDAGGLIRAAMNSGKSTPINIRIIVKDLLKGRKIAEKMLAEVKQIDGVVDPRILQRLDYPEYFINVDRSKAADMGLTVAEVMRNVIAAISSSVQFNKRIFWIDPVSHNQYFVGVQYREEDVKSLETILNIPIAGKLQKKAVPLSQVVKIERLSVPAEILHTNLQSSIDLTMGVEGRDLGHVAADVTKIVQSYGVARADGGWNPYDPDLSGGDKKTLKGSKITLTGEYEKMQSTFVNQAIGMVLAITLIYFLMVALFKSYITPLVVLSAVPVGFVGVITMMFVTKTALNVQSLLGMIFMVGIVVSNTVLLTDFAQNLRIAEKLSPTQAIVKAAGIRVRPVVMTALATFFALIPMSLGLSRGSEANVPLGRAVLGGLLAGMVTTLLVVPCFYSLLVKDSGDLEEEDLSYVHDKSHVR